MRGVLIGTLGLVLACTLACAEGDPCGDRDDILESPEGLLLTAEEHGAGWGATACATCHPSWTYHQANCTSMEGLDMALVRELSDPADPGTCMPCHGTNGVEP